MFHATVEDGRGILLDLAGNRYLSLGPFSNALWRHLVDGAPLVTDGVSARPAWAADLGMVFERQRRLWQAAGLVLPDDVAPAAALVPLAPAKPPASRQELREGALTGRVGWISLIKLIWTFARAEWGLRRWGLPSALRWAQRPPPARPLGLLHGRVQRFLKAYHFMRRVYGLGKKDCLPRSIALARCLARMGLGAEICIGVRGTPFQAHAWVESHGTVLSDRLSAIEPFVVIARF